MTQVLRRALFCNIRISLKAEFVSHQLPFNCARLLHRNHVIKCFTAPVASANDPIKNGSSVSFFSSGSTNKMAADSKKPPEFKIEEQKHPVEHEEKPEEKSVPMRKRILITGMPFPYAHFNKNYHNTSYINHALRHWHALGMFLNIRNIQIKLFQSCIFNKARVIQDFTILGISDIAAENASARKLGDEFPRSH